MATKVKIIEYDDADESAIMAAGTTTTIVLHDAGTVSTDVSSAGTYHEKGIIDGAGAWSEKGIWDGYACHPCGVYSADAGWTATGLCDAIGVSHPYGLFADHGYAEYGIVWNSGTFADTGIYHNGMLWPNGVLDAIGSYHATGIIDGSAGWSEHGILDEAGTWHAAGVYRYSNTAGQRFKQNGIIAGTSPGYPYYANGVLEANGTTYKTLAATDSTPYLAGAASGGGGSVANIGIGGGLS